MKGFIDPEAGHDLIKIRITPHIIRLYYQIQTKGQNSPYSSLSSFNTDRHHPRQVQHIPQHRLSIIVLAPHREIKLFGQRIHLDPDLLFLNGIDGEDFRVDPGAGVEPFGQMKAKVFFQTESLPIRPHGIQSQPDVQ